LTYAEAAAQIAFILNEARRLRLTGIALKAESPQPRLIGANGL
jgi:hypothetical protein